ncbi:lysin B [Rhodococcus phage Apiary]|nr:lysin B [Rhodococcus phage Maselop]WNM67404.1 lysin B [Rhodococcus phage Polyyuki]WNM69828.1 lysin B [Rhodococcus phage Apiary]
MIHVLVLGGTSESYPDDQRTEVPSNTMLYSITRHLDPAHFHPARWVGYPAQYAGSMDYEESVQVAIGNTYQVLGETMAGPGWAEGDRFWLIGYSQGATVVRRMNELLLGENPTAESIMEYRNAIAGISCVADPYRPEGVALGFDPGGYGVAGKARYDKGTPMLQVAADRDPICAAPYNSFIRTVADFTGYFAMDKASLQEWARDLIKRIKSQGWQNANLDWGQFWLFGQRVDNAIDQLGGYLPRSEIRNPIPGLPPIVINPGGGRHTCYNIERMPNSPYTYCERIALEMNHIARRNHQ